MFTLISSSEKIKFNSDSAVGIAAGYGLDDRGVGVRVPLGSRIFSSPRSPDRLQWLPGALSLGEKQQGREADHSLPTSAEVMKMWTYKSAPPCLHSVVLN
jgi:hypothetical protein